MFLPRDSLYHLWGAEQKAALFLLLQEGEDYCPAVYLETAIQGERLRSVGCVFRCAAYLGRDRLIERYDLHEETEIICLSALDFASLSAFAGYWAGRPSGLLPMFGDFELMPVWQKWTPSGFTCPLKTLTLGEDVKYIYPLDLFAYTELTKAKGTHSEVLLR